MSRFQHIFYSGMSSSSDLLGAIDAGVDIGVVAGRLAGFSAIWSLMRHLENGHAVFIDSGAFGERKSGIEPDWESVLSIYESLAELTDSSLDQLYVVAPDKVGDQTESLARLYRYRDRIRNLIDIGIQVIIPYQVGQLDGATLHQTMTSMLKTNRFIVGVPSNRDAMPVMMLETIVHSAYHILGRVQKNADQIERLKAIISASPDASITADASWLLSRMGRICEASNNIRAQHHQKRQGSFSSLDTPRRTAVCQTIKLDTSWVRQ